MTRKAKRRAKAKTKPPAPAATWPELPTVRKLSELKPYPNNPRTHPAEQIALLASMLKRWGPDQPIVVDEDDVILKGHGRWMAAPAAGFASFPVVKRIGLSDDEKKAMRIADNQSALLSGWNYDLLRAEATSLKTSGYDMALLAFPPATVRWITGGDLVVSPDANAEWGGMPHFENPDAKAFRSIVLHFKDQEAVDQFQKAVGLSINDKTRFLWYPDIEIVPFTKWKTDESQVSDLHRQQGAVVDPPHRKGARKDRRAVPDGGRRARA